LRGAFDAPCGFSFTCAIRAKDGSRRILKTTGHVRVDAAGVDSAFGVSQDITRVHMAESHLRASEEQYRLLTQHASDIICRLTPAGVIEFISPSVLRLTGRRPGTLAGLNFVTLLPESEHEAFADFLARLRRGEEDIVCTVRFRGESGKEGWLEISGRTLEDEADRVCGLVCAARDISERKAFELELEKARRRAEDISEAKSKFLANVSHELRTPLNAILGFSELIRDGAFGADSEARLAEYAGLIHESGSLLNSLVSDLLDLAKIEAGKYDLHQEHITLSEVVPFCLRQIEAEAVRKKIGIEDNISETGLSVLADKRALTQMLTNLLSNAVKFTPEGGRITLSVHPHPEGIRLSVKDTGIGISEEDIERVTAPFEQVGDSSRLALKGSGLGLAIVKSLAELHGGTLTIESEPGVGTCVTVRLPAADSQRSKAA
jgi:PAS domain S-box-containing protein